MKPHYVLVCAALALAACGQAAAPKEEAPPAPASLFEQIQAQPGETQLVSAYEAFVAFQASHPDSQPACTRPADREGGQPYGLRGTEVRGVIPDNVAPDSIYAGYKGAAVYSIQCGERATRAALDPREHWLVIYAPGATEVSIVNCASANGRSDLCPGPVPLVAATTP
jgi:hypothetical protein